MISQQLALECIKHTYQFPTLETTTTTSSTLPKNEWFEQYRYSLENIRKELWPILEPLGTVKTYGAFYFLVPLPVYVSEDEAVDILAREYNILLMHGTPFGAKDHLRLSYGSIPMEQVTAVLGKLKDGFDHLQRLSRERRAMPSL